MNVFFQLKRFLGILLILFIFFNAYASDPKIEILTSDHDVIWGFDFLDSNQIIFSERNGKLKILDLKSKKVFEVAGLPEVWSKGQGGLLDVRVHYKDKNKVYLTYSDPVSKSKATTSLGVGTLKGNKLVDFKRIFKAYAESDNAIHFGSRIEFDKNGFLFMTIGDRNERPKVQSLEHHNGKIVRLNEDGSIPKDNPFVADKKARPEIWTLGHRSPQGLFYDEVRKKLWMTEMGPRGGDELNLIEKKKNYGWPVVTFGNEYSGFKVGDGITEKAGMEQPLVYWVPSISPSGMVVYNGDQLKNWKHNLFLGCLSGQQIRRLVMKEDKIIEQESLLEKQGERFRQLHPGPDGYLYYSTDSGKISRIISVN